MWVYYYRTSSVRLAILKEYGGIYLDLDVYLLGSLNYFRQFSFVMSLDATIWNVQVNNGIIFSSINSSFLRTWEGAHHNFNPNSWDEFSSRVPYTIWKQNKTEMRIEAESLSILWQFSYQVC